MDIDTVAELLGVSTRQIRTYVNAGMPAGKDGRKPVFNWREVFNWYLDYRAALDYGDRPQLRDDEDGEDADLDELPPPSKNDDIRAVTLRRARADADLKELALSQKRGEVIVIADAKTRLDRMMGNLRAKLLGLTPKLSSRIDAVKTRPEREAAIKEELENLCREISTGVVVDVTTSAETVELQATADPHFIAGLYALSQTDALRQVNNLILYAREIRNRLRARGTTVEGDGEDSLDLHHLEADYDSLER